jgi:hypothetical protein
MSEKAPHLAVASEKAKAVPLELSEMSCIKTEITQMCNQRPANSQRSKVA